MQHQLDFPSRELRLQLLSSQSTTTAAATTTTTFIHSISIAPLQVHYYSRGAPDSTNTVSEFCTEAPHATTSEGPGSLRRG